MKMQIVAAVTAAALAAFAPATASRAAVVGDPSFENVELPDTIPSAFPGEFLLPNWVTTGNDLQNQIVNTGFFQTLDNDIESPPMSGVFAKRITNAHGGDQHSDNRAQLAFISAA